MFWPQKKWYWAAHYKPVNWPLFFSCNILIWVFFVQRHTIILKILWKKVSAAFYSQQYAQDDKRAKNLIEVSTQRKRNCYPITSIAVRLRIAVDPLSQKFWKTDTLMPPSLADCSTNLITWTFLFVNWTQQSRSWTQLANRFWFFHPSLSKTSIVVKRLSLFSLSSDVKMFADLEIFTDYL